VIPTRTERTQWVYSGGLGVVSARTNKSHHHHQSLAVIKLEEAKYANEIAVLNHRALNATNTDRTDN
jgi:hypothetical protein